MRKDIKGHYAPYPADFDGKVTSIESFDYVDTYVAFTNKKNYDSWENTNALYNLYKITVKTDKEKKAVSFYASIYCSNIVATGETFTEEPYFSTSYYNKEADFKKKVIEAEGYTTTTLVRLQSLQLTILHQLQQAKQQPPQLQQQRPILL